MNHEIDPITLTFQALITVCLASTCSLAFPMPMEKGYKYPEPKIPFTLPTRRTTTTTTTTRAPTIGYREPVGHDIYLLKLTFIHTIHQLPIENPCNTFDVEPKSSNGVLHSAFKSLIQ